MRSRLAEVSSVVGSEHDANSQAAFPRSPAALSGRPVKDLEALGNIDVFFQLQACAARGVVDEQAFDHRGFRSRPQEYLAGLGDPALGTHAHKQSRFIHDQILFGGPFASLAPASFLVALALRRVYFVDQI